MSKQLKGSVGHPHSEPTLSKTNESTSDLNVLKENLEALMAANNRYESFASMKSGCHAKWYVDGKQYFADVADALEGAKSEVFITDWSLNPELFLRREHGVSSLKDRLDKILLKKALEGVHVYVIVWFETASAMAGTVHSQHVVETLEGLHSNIKVLRHPGGKTKVYWTHHQKTCVIDRRLAFVGGIDLCFGRYDTPEHPLVDECHLSPVFPGKDYYNPAFQDFMNLEQPFVDLVDRTVIPRMPWHDIHARVDGKAAQDVGINFIQRWNHHLTKKLNSGDIRTKGYPFLNHKEEGLPVMEEKIGQADVQVLRSISHWSCGVEKTERSICKAYLDLIANAEHCIYIENQYFISVENQLTNTLFLRIAKAIEEKQTFRVMVLLPITPCGDWMTTSIKFVMKWQYDTICRGGESLLERLQKKFPTAKLSDYISFYSLRQVDILNETVVSDQIYIHSKLIIVDDRHVIIGSANYNDRSMTGDRDSEICVLVQDNEMVQSKMNGKFYLAAKFAHTLRTALYMEHLGLKPGQEELVRDPTSEETYRNLFLRTAEVNQRIFINMFPVTPNDMLRTISDVKEAADHFRNMGAESRKMRNENLKESIPRIQGHLIPYPLHFLESERLDAGVSVERILPPKVFH